MADEPHRRKVVTIGEHGVGKTSLIYALAGKSEEREGAARMGIDFTFRMVTTEGGDRLRLMFFDTAGMERFQRSCLMMRSYLRNADVVLLVYDISKRESFDEVVKEWFPQYVDLVELSSAEEQRARMILVGTNAHLDEMKCLRNVARAEAEQWTASHGMPFMEVSATTGEGIYELLQIVMTAALTERHFCGHRPVQHGAGKLGVRLPPSWEAKEISKTNSGCAGGC